MSTDASLFRLFQATCLSGSLLTALCLLSVAELDHAKLPLAGREARLREALLLARLLRLGAGDDTPPLVLLEVPLRQAARRVVGRPVHHLRA
jgi:hypothetical protein